MGSPRVLTEEAKAALAEVRRLRGIQLEARAVAEAEARRVLEEGTRESEAALGAAVRAALTARVPRDTVRSEGLSTTDWRTVARFEAVAPIGAAV